MQALLGTRTAADINLVLQLLILAGLIAGFYLARRKRFDQHANMQTAMVLANLVLIAAVMATSFYAYIIAGGTTTGPVAQLMIGHAALGVVVELVALYLILRMRTQIIPSSLRVRNIKAVMRATLAMWTLLVVLGVGIYIERYLLDRDVRSAPLAEFRQLGADLYVHAVELDDAVQRGSAPAAKRHAEHLINLIEGKNGLRYGDNDTNGYIEDPGDGVGLLARLESVAMATNDPAAMAEADAVRDQLAQIVTRTTDMLGPQPVEQHGGAAAEVLDLARQANGEGVFQIDLAASAAGVVQAPSVIQLNGATGQPSSVIVRENNFTFIAEEMTIPVGTTVVWTNDEQAKHTVTADDGLFDSGDQGLGESYSYTFTEPGSYPYFCRYHGDVDGVGMAGTINVQ